MNSFALRLILKLTEKGTRKWPIAQWFCQGCCLTGAQQPGAPKKMIWAPKVFAAAPNTLPVGLLTSRLLPFWAP